MKNKWNVILAAIIFGGCSLFSNGINVFPVTTDLAFGAQVASDIDKENSKSLLDSASNSVIYRYLYSIRDSILKNNEIEHENKFPWRIRIIKDDQTLNAFCTPGGYIYFYTGILKYLQSEDELAGVMGHEMAHAAKRHSTDALTRQYGVTIFTQLLIDTQYHDLSQIAAGLALLKYGRKDELQSDEFSVRWLYNTSYNPTGAAGFFERMNASGGQRVPAFLSTHPDPGKRVEKIHALHKKLGGKSGNKFEERYKLMMKYI